MDYIQILTTVATFITIMATLLTGFVWMDGKFNGIDHRFYKIEQDVAVIKNIIEASYPLSNMNEGIGK